jgi:DNA-binding transcriptional LysR family regulator
MQFSGHIASRIKLRDIHILMAVEQAGSMNKAAVVLNMTQPAVSRSIAELERALGVSLLDRNAPAGFALLDAIDHSAATVNFAPGSSRVLSQNARIGGVRGELLR